MDDSGHRHVQKAHVAKKLRKRNVIWFRAQQLAAGVSPLPLPRD